MIIRGYLFVLFGLVPSATEHLPVTVSTGECNGPRSTASVRKILEAMIQRAAILIGTSVQVASLRVCLGPPQVFASRRQLMLEQSAINIILPKVTTVIPRSAFTTSWLFPQEQVSSRLVGYPSLSSSLSASLSFLFGKERAPSRRQRLTRSCKSTSSPTSSRLMRGGVPAKGPTPGCTYRRLRAPANELRRFRQMRHEAPGNVPLDDSLRPLVIPFPPLLSHTVCFVPSSFFLACFS